MYRVVVMALFLAGCVGVGGTRPPLEPPVPAGAHPAVGREFSLELEGGDGREVRVAPVPGRVLVACLAGADSPPGEGACEAVHARWRDRVTVIGILEGGRPAPESMGEVPYRNFADPDRRAVEKYRLEQPPLVVIADSRGRVAAVLAADRIDRVEPEVERLLFGIVSPEGSETP